MYATALVLLAAAATAIVGRPSKGVPHLPVLNQIPRSDWLNAKEGCNTSQLVKAKGDGKTDDTFALQLCFDAMSASKPNSTVYIPPGNYVIKNTLVLKKVLGGTIIGHGETTILTWRGKVGGNATMIWSDGVSRSRMLGFVLDGRAGADIGVDHYSNHSLFETRLRHQNQKFLGFSLAGIRVGGCSASGCVQSAEIIYENIIFDSCGHGCKGLPYAPMSGRGCGAVVLLDFNDYDNLFDGAHFSNNSFGIYNDKMANVYIRNSRFEMSAFADVWLAASCGNSIRRSVSQGSNQFVSSPARNPDGQ
eukprot:gene19012-6423_t